MKKLRKYIVLVAISATFNASAQGSATEQAQIQEALKVPVAQQKLADCSFGPTTPLSFGSGTMAADAGGTVTLKGVDHQGKMWSAVYQANPGTGCQLWSADLNPNGEKDLAFVQFGINSSGGWDTVLSVLAFDNKGRPFPWQATSKFTIGDTGIQQIVLLGPEKKAAIVVPVQQTDGQGNSGVDFHSYVARGSRFGELLGPYGGINWPLLSPQSLQVRSLSSVAQTLSTAGQSSDSEEMPSNSTVFKGVTGETDSDRRLVLANATIPVPDVLVIDSSTDRRIISSPLKADLLNVRMGYAQGVALGENCASGECHPMVVWFKQ